MSRVPLRIHQDIILTDQMFLDPPPGGAVLLLPAKTRYEQDDGGIETTTERRIAFSPEIPRQVGEARAEWKILREVAAATYPERQHLLGCETGDQMRAEIARIVPFYDGCQHLKKTGDAFQYGGARLCDDGAFGTPDGKAHFKAVPLPRHSVGRATDATDEDKRSPGQTFVVSTRRGKQFNTLIYAEIDPLTGAPRDAVFIHPEDAARHRLAKGDRVALINDVGRFEGTVFPVIIAPGNLQVHWPEGNGLLRSGVTDPVGGVPEYNAEVRIERVN
jgi:anaerobic selenocysteine-containing dehydrogenase